MSGSVNKVILVGNLGRDPEVRTFPSGDKVVSFSMAMTESWRDKATGERKDKTEWVNVSIFNEALGRVAEQYCRKGSKIYLEGQLQTREYTDKDGNQRKATEVVLQRFRGELTLLDSRNSRGEASCALCSSAVPAPLRWNSGNTASCRIQGASSASNPTSPRESSATHTWLEPLVSPSIFGPR